MELLVRGLRVALVNRRKISLGPTVEQQDRAMARLKKRTEDPPSCVHGYSGNGAGCEVCELATAYRTELDTLRERIQEQEDTIRELRGERQRLKNALSEVSDLAERVYGRPTAGAAVTHVITRLGAERDVLLTALEEIAEYGGHEMDEAGTFTGSGCSDKAHDALSVLRRMR